MREAMAFIFMLMMISALILLPMTLALMVNPLNLLLGIITYPIAYILYCIITTER